MNTEDAESMMFLISYILCWKCDKTVFGCGKEIYGISFCIKFKSRQR